MDIDEIPEILPEEKIKILLKQRNEIDEEIASLTGVCAQSQNWADKQADEHSDNLPKNKGSR